MPSNGVKRLRAGGRLETKNLRVWEAAPDTVFIKKKSGRAADVRDHTLDKIARGRNIQSSRHGGMSVTSKKKKR